MTQQVGGDDAAVYNPATLPAELGRIAAQRPDLRLAIAQHPAAYPALLDWLAAQGDPQVVAVVAARRAAWSVAAQPPAYEQPWAQSAQNQPPVTVPLPTAPAPYGQSGQPSVNTPQPMYGTPSQPIQGSPRVAKRMVLQAATDLQHKPTSSMHPRHNTIRADPRPEMEASEP